MGGYTHRQRVLAALEHREPDRVPVDLGGGMACGINVRAYENLKRHLGIQKPTSYNRRGQGAVVDEEVQQRLDVDVRELRPGGPDVWPEDRMLPDGRLLDEWGVIWRQPAVGGPYIPDRSPLQTADPTSASLDHYKWPDPRDPGRTRGLREAAIALREQTDCAISMRAGFLTIVQMAHWLRGFEEWHVDLALNRRFAAALLERVTDVVVESAVALLEVAGEFVDVVAFGDDICSQSGPMFSPDFYRMVIKPHHRRLVEAIKRLTRAKVFFHSCGSIVTYLPDFIDIGVDIINPVQVSARGMDTRRLKAEFGDKLTFWGAIDTQQVLPRGTPQQVREEVRRRIEDLAAGGGFVLASVHSIQAEVPPENIVAMVEAAHEYGGYG